MVFFMFIFPKHCIWVRVLVVFKKVDKKTIGNFSGTSIWNFIQIGKTCTLIENWKSSGIKCPSACCLAVSNQPGVNLLNSEVQCET